MKNTGSLVGWEGGSKTRLPMAEVCCVSVVHLLLGVSVGLASPKAARAMKMLPGRRATQSAILPRPTRLLVRGTSPSVC